MDSDDFSPFLVLSASLIYGVDSLLRSLSEHTYVMVFASHWVHSALLQCFPHFEDL